MKGPDWRRHASLGLVAAFVYMMWYLNGVRFGFSLTWISMALFGFPLVLLSLEMYVRSGGRRVKPPHKEAAILALLAGFGMSLGTFESYGWWSALWLLFFLPIAAYEAWRGRQVLNRTSGAQGRSIPFKHTGP